MILTYEYRLLPSKSQHRALDTLIESQRLLYNAALEERIGANRRGVRRTYIDQTKALTEWRQSDPEAASVPATLQRATLKRVDQACTRHSQRLIKGAKAGHPRFRGPGRFKSFGFTEFSGISLEENRLRFKGMPGRLRIHMHRPLPPGVRLRACTFRRDAKGWKVGFAVEISISPLRNETRCVGIDLGITTFAALSDGGFIPSLRAARRAERRLRLAQRSLARKRRDSKGRHVARAVVSRCHAATARSRRDFLHQVSARMTRDYDLIAVEGLNVQALARGVLAREVHDASWRRFLSMLHYKAERAGVRIIEVDPHNTSQNCSGCGSKVPKRLAERRHDCHQCGLSIDRDLNAARNILYRAGAGPGLQNVASCGKRADGNLCLTEDPGNSVCRAS